MDFTKSERVMLRSMFPESWGNWRLLALNCRALARVRDAESWERLAGICESKIK